MERVASIESVCRRHGVRLASAALQFPLGHPNVATLIPGARSPDEIAQNKATFEVEIPAAFWADLKRHGLLREDAPTPG
jgi:D-threo-aldose 1-dehydrogenase